MIYVNERGDTLELCGLESRRAYIQLTPADGKGVIFYKRYEYWERLQAHADYETLVQFAHGNKQEEDD
jgi:hypothetical protein